MQSLFTFLELLAGQPRMQCYYKTKRLFCLRTQTVQTDDETRYSFASAGNHEEKMSSYELHQTAKCCKSLCLRYSTF